jgi:hypothetical protein
MTGGGPYAWMTGKRFETACTRLGLNVHKTELTTEHFKPPRRAGRAAELVLTRRRLCRLGVIPGCREAASPDSISLGVWLWFCGLATSRCRPERHYDPERHPAEAEFHRRERPGVRRPSHLTANFKALQSSWRNDVPDVAVP